MEEEDEIQLFSVTSTRPTAQNKTPKHNVDNATSEENVVSKSRKKKNTNTEEQIEHEESALASGDDTVSLATFASLSLAPWLQKQCSVMGMPRPTEIQEKCIPAILKGGNCIGAAKTGSGKTAAFALPILQKLCQDPYGIYALILTPTRELAFQISEQFEALGKPNNVRVCVVVGGLDMMKQAVELSRRPHVVIATPGRLADHINSSANVTLDRLKFLVLDEADRILSDTFTEHLETILQHIPSKRQTLLFSATMTNNETDLKRVGCNGNITKWEVKSKEATVTKLDQRYIFIPVQVKDCYILSLLREFAEKGSIIVFAATCKGCESLALMMRELGYPCTALHSKMPQTERLASLAKFRSSLIKILVATDVASRGLDIPTVETVLNFDVPSTTEDYIHRVGRTARAGRGGVAITLVTQHDIERVHKIEERINKKLVLFETDEDEVLKQLSKVTKARRAALLTMSEKDFGQKDKINAQKTKLLAAPEPAQNKKRKVAKSK